MFLLNDGLLYNFKFKKGGHMRLAFQRMGSFLGFATVEAKRWGSFGKSSVPNFLLA